MPPRPGYFARSRRRCRGHKMHFQCRPNNELNAAGSSVSGTALHVVDSSANVMRTVSKRCDPCGMPLSVSPAARPCTLLAVQPTLCELFRNCATRVVCRFQFRRCRTVKHSQLDRRLDREPPRSGNTARSRRRSRGHKMHFPCRANNELNAAGSSASGTALHIVDCSANIMRTVSKHCDPC